MCTPIPVHDNRTPTGPATETPMVGWHVNDVPGGAFGSLARISAGAVNTTAVAAGTRGGGPITRLASHAAISSATQTKPPARAGPINLRLGNWSVAAALQDMGYARPLDARPASCSDDAAGAKDLLSVAFHPDIGPPVPCQPAVVSTRLADNEHVAPECQMPPVPRRRDAPARAPAELVLPVADRPARADQVHGTIDAMHHGDPVAQPAGVLDLDGDVEEPVAVEVAELIGRVELRRERELTTQARRDQSAVGPAGEASKGRARDLGGRRCDTEKSDGQHGFHMHIRDTPARRTPLGRAWRCRLDLLE